MLKKLRNISVSAKVDSGCIRYAQNSSPTMRGRSTDVVRSGGVCCVGVLNIGTNRGVLQDRMPSQHNEGLILWDARGTPLAFIKNEQQVILWTSG